MTSAAEETLLTSRLIPQVAKRYETDFSSKTLVEAVNPSLNQARVSLARAAYSDSDIVLLDDPLSAVDSQVGKSILENCLLSGPLAKRTRILVTHALHVLDKTDYIYVMDNGVIIEQGTYEVPLSMSSELGDEMTEWTIPGSYD